MATKVKTSETVDLIASGYEWECPRCGYYNREIEADTQSVTCRNKNCGSTFEVGEVLHAGKYDNF